jgi:hypothetical protein
MSGGDQAIRVNLDLDASADAIHGTLEHRDGRRERFWGWLDLMAAVERVTDNSSDDRNGQVDQGGSQ